MYMVSLRDPVERLILDQQLPKGGATGIAHVPHSTLLASQPHLDLSVPIFHTTTHRDERPVLVLPADPVA